MIIAPSCCIDVVFKSNPSFTSASGVELLLYEIYHHNLIYGKINFTVPLPPPYIREVGITKMQRLKIFSDQFLVLTGILFSKEKLLIERLIF